MSDRDGWNHVYVVSRDGKKTRLVTKGDFDVLDVQGIDAKGGWLYYVASPENPAQRYLFRTRLDGKGKPERLSPARESGTHAYDVAPNYRYAIETYSSLGNPPIIRLVRLPGHQPVRTLVDNQRLALEGERAPARARSSGSRSKPKLALKMPGRAAEAGGLRLHPQVPAAVLRLRRAGRTPRPTIVWGGYYLWHTMLTQKGYLVAIVDNRGTPAPLGRKPSARRSTDSSACSRPEDQAAAARTLLQRPYVDSARVGIWGWSYGAFMALNALFQHPDLYRTGVAVSPVTHWSLYDNVYTERFNGLITDNREGYDRGSPLSYVNGLRGNLLLVHGGGDDNVHYQNTEMLINALVAANRPFEMMEYPNRTHCICQGKGTQVHLFDLVTRFLDRNLMHATPGPAAAGARQPRGNSGRRMATGGERPYIAKSTPAGGLP